MATKKKAPKANKKQLAEDFEEIMDLVDSKTLPEVLSQTEALEFLEDLRSGLDTRIDCLRDEIESGEG